jgi:hypothetical protein
MSDRDRLPNSRPSETFDFEHGGVQYTATIGRFDSGALSEIFLNAGKLGSTANIVAREAAVIFSIARQFGAPVETLCAALPKLPDNSAAGPLGKALEIAKG